MRCSRTSPSCRTCCSACGRCRRSDAQTAAQRALSRVGLRRLRRTPIRTCCPAASSSAWRWRAPSRRGPGVILMDEPFSNLDRRMRDAVREETVALLREMGATTIIVTHDPEEAMRIADRIVLMRAGRIVQAGSGRRSLPAAGRPRGRAVLLRFQRGRGPCAAAGGRRRRSGSSPRRACRTAPAVVCVRPQAIRLRAAGFCLPGRVLSRRFLGEVDLLEIAVQGLDAPLRARLRGSPQAREGAGRRHRHRSGRGSCFCRTGRLGSRQIYRSGRAAAARGP